MFYGLVCYFVYTLIVLRGPQREDWLYHLNHPPKIKSLLTYLLPYLPTYLLLTDNEMRHLTMQCAYSVFFFKKRVLFNEIK